MRSPNSYFFVFDGLEVSTSHYIVYLVCVLSYAYFHAIKSSIKAFVFLGPFLCQSKCRQPWSCTHRVTDLRQSHFHLSTNSPSPSLRTVNHWVSKFKWVDSDLLKLDVPYEGYLQEHDSVNEQERNFVYRMLRIKNNATVQEVYWWRKINEMGNDIPDKNLISVAQECVINQHKEILAISKLDWAKIWDKIQGCYQDPTNNCKIFVAAWGIHNLLVSTHPRIPDWVVEGELLSITRTPEQVTVIGEEVPLPPVYSSRNGMGLSESTFWAAEFFFYY